MSTAYSSLHSFALAVSIISAVGVSLWGRWAMFRLRKLGNGTDAAESLMTKIGFAFRSLAFVPLLLVMVFVPPFLCSGTECQPADFANTRLIESLVLALFASAIWVWFVFSRVYISRAEKFFGSLSSRETSLLLAAAGGGAVALLLMVLGSLNLEGTLTELGLS